ncbi:MAG: AAA-like domain-containing protein [Armatimonadetes bacterium]|nr:AAA-like domain-containing protein [Armatimonadota bacterium]
MECSAPFFSPGGTLDPDAPSYIERDVDARLFDMLMAGEYVFLLDSRQKGKSSLVARAIRRLSANGIATVKIDFQRLGANVTTEQWYAGMLLEIGQELHLEEELFENWNGNRELGPLARWIRALRTVVLLPSDRPIVIFFDEIDYVRALPFATDEFFAGIRDCFNRRSEGAEFRKLTFCLVGVATPTQLIRNSEITPFNIGSRIDISDFRMEELDAYSKALDAAGKDGTKLLKRVHYWVEGHPYLTQLLCSQIVKAAQIHSANDVDRLVRDTFLTPEARHREPNFADVERRILDPDVPGLSHDERRSQVLDLYGRMLKGRRVEGAEENPVVATVRLSGLGIEEKGVLRIRNRTYRAVFDEGWRRQSLPEVELRRQRGVARLAVLRTSAIAGVLLCAIGAAAVGFWRLSSDRQRLITELESKTTKLGKESYMGLMASIRLASNSAMWERTADLVERAKSDPNRGWEWGHWALSIGCDFEAKVSRNSVFEPQPDGTLEIVGADAAYQLTLQGATLKQKLVPISPEGTPLPPAGPAARLPRMNLLRRGNLRLWRDARTSGYSICDSETDRELIRTKPETLVFDVDPIGRNYLLQSAKTPQIVELRSVDNNRVLAIFKNPSPIDRIAFIGDGSIISVGTSTRDRSKAELRRWNAKGNTLSVVDFRIRPGSPPGFGICFSPDRSVFAVFSEEECQVRRTTDFSIIATLPQHEFQSIAIAFSPDNRYLATGDGTGVVRLIELQRGQLKRSFVGLGAVWSIAFFPDGERLAAADWEGDIKVWRSESLAPMEAFDDAPATSAYLTRNGATLVLATKDGTVVSRNLATGAVSRRNVEDPSRKPSFANGWGPLDAVILGFPDGSVAKLNASSLKEEARTKVFSECQWVLRVLSGGHRLLALAFGDTKGKDNCAILDARSLRVIARFTYSPLPERPELLEASSDTDAKLLAMCSRGSPSVSIFSAEDGMLVQEIRPESPIWFIALSPDGSETAVSVGKVFGAADSRIELFETRTGFKKGVLTKSSGVGQLAYSPTKKMLAGVVWRGVALWDLSSKRQIAGLSSGHVSINQVRFSPDGERIITAGQEGSTTLWDGTTGAELISLGYSSFPSRFRSASVWMGNGSISGERVNRTDRSFFSADGRDVVTVCQDGLVRIWHSLPWKHQPKAVRK